MAGDVCRGDSAGAYAGAPGGIVASKALSREPSHARAAAARVTELPQYFLKLELHPRRQERGRDGAACSDLVMNSVIADVHLVEVDRVVGQFVISIQLEV